jgi:hypothetical protein
MFGLLQIWENVSEMLFLPFLRKQQEAPTDFCIIRKKRVNCAHHTTTSQVGAE